jgi:hypothetical protein
MIVVETAAEVDMAARTVQVAAVDTEADQGHSAIGK